MTDRVQYAEDDPRPHIITLRELLADAIEHACQDLTKNGQPEEQARLGATAQVRQAGT
ncbi:hypothetical protein [Nonomuraea jabiensis]|uniref:hypothetical protein n=1 Tax=Nonomuraea jabiensis TaxID=882448 RepID=UPI003D7087D4